MKVELLKPHTHAGAKYDAGDVIEVSGAQAEWLQRLGVAKPQVTEASGSQKQGRERTEKKRRK